MILCLDIGNSHIFAGVFERGKIIVRFRHDTVQAVTSDQLGVFLRAVLREHDIDYRNIKDIAVSSVVPNLDYSCTAACIKYFDVQPFFLRAGVKTGIKIKTNYPNELGADLIASAIAAVEHFSGRNLIIVDCGTATTYSTVGADKTFFGVVIQTGMRLSMTALQQHTANLPGINIVRPQACLGKNTIGALQAGLYYGHLGAMREIIDRIAREAFGAVTADAPPLVVATGGFAHLFKQEKLFDHIESDLNLHGIYAALQLNVAPPRSRLSHTVQK